MASSNDGIRNIVTAGDVARSQGDIIDAALRLANGGAKIDDLVFAVVNLGALWVQYQALLEKGEIAATRTDAGEGIEMAPIFLRLKPWLMEWIDGSRGHLSRQEFIRRIIEEKANA